MISLKDLFLKSSNLEKENTWEEANSCRCLWLSLTLQTLRDSSLSYSPIIPSTLTGETWPESDACPLLSLSRQTRSLRPSLFLLPDSYSSKSRLLLLLLLSLCPQILRSKLGKLKVLWKLSKKKWSEVRRVLKKKFTSNSF